LSSNTQTTEYEKKPGAVLSLYHLLNPEVLANPYPLFHRLRAEDPVHWDPYLHAWVVTRYADVVRVLMEFSAERTPTPERLREMGMDELSPIAKVMVKQMLFLDPPAHSRIRSLASFAFTPQRVAVLRDHIRDIVKALLDAVEPVGCMDLIADLGEPLPSRVTAEMLGVPVEDAPQLKAWSDDFAEMLGNFQHNPERASRVRRSLKEMTEYFEAAIRRTREYPREGLIHSFLIAEVEGDRFTEEEVIANIIVTMVGGMETTTNLIANGVLTLLRNPDEFMKLKSDHSLIPSAVEEMLRYEPPSQQTARLAPFDTELGGKKIRKQQAVIAVMAAGNRDPERFPDPDRFDISRTDNRHLSFGWAAHFCFGAALARIEGQAAFEGILQRIPNLKLTGDPLVWRSNLGLRGLTTLRVTF
jgi:cytochrome P450